MTSLAARLDAKAVILIRRYPRILRAFKGLVFVRYAIVGFAAFAFGVIDGRGPVSVFDMRLFLRSGRLMLSPGWAETFSNPELQEGPPQILFYGLIGRLSEIAGVSPKLLLSVSVQVAFALLLMLVIRSLLNHLGARRPGIELYAGLLAVGGFATWSAFGSGHLAEAFIPLLWVQAAIDLRRSRRVRPGVLIGMAAALKLWGVLGLPIFLFGTGLRRTLIDGLVASIVLASWWVPFIVFGEVNTFQFEWTVQVTSFIYRVTGELSPVTWWMRTIQGFAAVCAGVATWFRLKNSKHAIWLVPFTMVAMRLVLDPTIYFYYSVPLAVLALIAAAVLSMDAPVPFRLPLYAGMFLLLHPAFVIEERMLALYSLILSVVMVAVFGSKSNWFRRSPIEASHRP